jgi:hypothetical protein
MPHLIQILLPTQSREGASVMVEVVVEVFDRDWWAGYREQLEQHFGQEEVHARVLAMEQI